MFGDKEFQRSVIVSLISSLLILIFFQPLMQVVWGLIQFIGANFYSGFSESVYRNAALGHRNYLDVIVFSAFTSAQLGIFVGLILRTITRRKMLSLTEVAKARLLKLNQLMLVASLAVVSVISLRFTLLAFADLQLNTGFQQRVTILSPYLSDNEIKQLNAMWASMKNRQDYERINTQLITYGQAYGVELPDPLWR